MTAWLAQHLIITVMLTIVVAVLCRLLRFRPAVCHALWLLVLLKLVTPPVVAWPWTIAQLVDGLQHISAERSASFQTEASDTNAPTATARLLRLIGNDDAPSTQGQLNPIRPSDGLRRGAYAALFGVWGLGIVLMIGLQGVRFVRFRRLSNGASRAPQGLETCLSDLALLFHIKPPALAASGGIASAITWSVAHPKVLVPETLLGEMDHERWRIVLAHELAHLKRRDHWTGWIELIAGCVWWWNPVFWYASKRLHESAEMACDAWVIWALPERRREYAETLVRITELASQSRAAIPVLGMGGGPAVAFERRLLMILRQQVPCRMPALSFALMLAFAAAVLPGWSQEPAASNAPPAPAPWPATRASVPAQPEPAKPNNLQKALDSPVSIEFGDIHMSEIIEFMSDSYEMNIALDSRVIALPRKRNPAGGGVAQTPENIVESNPDYVTDGMVPYINVRDVSTRDALSALLRPLNLTFTVGPTVVWISSPAMIEADAKYKPPSIDSASEGLAKKLQVPVSIEFESIHLQEILEFISDSFTVNTVLDNRVVRPILGSRIEIKVGSPGYVTDGIVPYINLKNVTLAEALEALLRTLNLTFKAEKDFIWISSHDLIDAPPLPAETVNAPAVSSVSPARDNPNPSKTIPTPNVPFEVARIFAAKSGGVAAQIRFDGRAEWYREGDPCYPYKVAKIDAKKQTVTLQRTDKDESVSRKSTNGVLKEPKPSGRANDRLARDLRALQIQKVGDSARVRIQTASATQWYRENGRFEEYTLLRIAPEAQTVTLYSGKKNVCFTLNVVEPK